MPRRLFWLELRTHEWLDFSESFFTLRMPASTTTRIIRTIFFVILAVLRYKKQRQSCASKVRTAVDVFCCLTTALGSKDLSFCPRAVDCSMARLAEGIFGRHTRRNASAPARRLGNKDLVACAIGRWFSRFDCGIHMNKQDCFI
jgi:hypothetical protein